MHQVFHIFKKEYKSYFVSPIAYIVISIFLLVNGWFFFSTFFIYSQATLRSFFNLLPIVFSFFVPAVTMRLFSEELNIGSYEVLITMPVTANTIILGKFLAAVAFIASMLVPTLAYAITVSILGQLDWGPVIGGYIGAILLGASFSAIGIFASSLTRNQIIAFIIGMAICFGLTIINHLSFLLPRSILEVLVYIGTGYHFQNISKGVIDSRDIIYFASLCFLGLYGAHLSIQQKR
ncbi:MAG: ABC-2 transporter permease [Deltaproteobacteria bacterium]|nr:ABC-2 transporter permease [Deltaproteobacteria bacterium]